MKAVCIYILLITNALIILSTSGYLFLFNILGKPLKKKVFLY